MQGTRVPGSFKISNRQRSLDVLLDPGSVLTERRVRGILMSLHRDLDEGGTARVRQILSGPRELYRIELERPDFDYQRTTVLDRDTLETLLEETPEDVLRERFIFRS